MEEQSHSFPLAHSLTPVVNFQNVKRTYLGVPYTPCTGCSQSSRYFFSFRTNAETFSTNNYTEVALMEQRKHEEKNDEKPYKGSYFTHNHK